MSLYEPDFNNMRHCDSCGQMRLKLHEYQGVKLCDVCINSIALPTDKTHTNKEGNNVNQSTNKIE